MIRIVSIQTGSVGDFNEDVVLISSDQRVEKWRLRIDYEVNGKPVASGSDTGSPVRLSPWRIGMARVKVPRKILAGSDYERIFSIQAAGAEQELQVAEEKPKNFFRRLFG